MTGRREPKPSSTPEEFLRAYPPGVPREPDRLLEGSGVQTRYVVVRSPDEVPEDGIRALIMAALHAAAVRRAR